jgi:hypothetical protein
MPAKAAENAEFKITMYGVRPGDTLASIAAARLHSPKLWPALWWANRSKIRNPDAIYAGQQLQLAPLPVQTPAIVAAADRAIPRAPAPPRTPAGHAPAPVTVVAAGTFQAYAERIVGAGQFGCLDALWNRESGWRVTAENPSGAYGIPQALPGGKMASAGADWASDGYTQIRWGLGYIRSTYGTPCGAWGHEEAAGWY